MAPSPLRNTRANLPTRKTITAPWFRELLREAEPGWYAQDCFCFVKADRFTCHLNFCIGGRTDSRFYSGCKFWRKSARSISAVRFVMEADALDPRFVEVQRRHLADEGRIFVGMGNHRMAVGENAAGFSEDGMPVFLVGCCGILLPPKRSAVERRREVIAEFPELADRKTTTTKRRNGVRPGACKAPGSRKRCADIESARYLISGQAWIAERGNSFFSDPKPGISDPLLDDVSTPTAWRSKKTRTAKTRRRAFPSS